MIALLVILLTVGYILFLGFSLWILIDYWMFIDVPPAIVHPMKFRILYSFGHLIFTWGCILEKIRICSMPRFCQFVLHLQPIRKDPRVVVTNLRFGTISVRLFQPKAVSSCPRRGVIFYHGGGAVIGSLDMYHSMCSFLALKTDSVVLSVGYRKLPDYHHPVSFRDCLNATVHFLKTLDTYGVDPSRVVVSGDSFGATIVAFVSQALVGRTDIPKLRGQILVYPALQGINLQLPSYQQNKKVPVLVTKFMICFCRYFTIDPSWKDALLKGACVPAHIWEKYKKWLSADNLPERFRYKYQAESPAPFNEAAYLETRHVFEVENAPLIADDQIIAQLPGALIVTCEWDSLRDDGLLYKKRLEDQGVPVTWYHAEDGFHGCLALFSTIFFNFPCCEKVMSAIVKYLREI
ncbi:PREDICTED: arylacetamide deacetylase-like 4 [Dipodomys ordii]|uniref:Arylacetamide deacetylase-like 4 n=1 Tax=Dipodomys ordii TaxID=10020 RepID=A0A1S3GHF5_DIPOR|nr:PREDICTED: arylacetamide deacetylase-like 4 [Dipodomys ordii]